MIRGLIAGFDGDFATAMAFLVPQLENSLRSILMANGHVPTKINDEGVQEELDLNALLADDRLKAVLNRDYIMELRGLLVEKGGPNLRNRFCHGLVDDDELESDRSFYLWWLLLRMCVLLQRPD